jgi:hypothetical protein
LFGTEEIRQALWEGRHSGPVRVDGRLDISHFPRFSLPSGLDCYELDARDSQLTHLPPDLRVDSRLILDDCTSLQTLPEGLSVGSLSLRNCTSLEALPENLNCWFLDLSGCVRFAHWPRQARIQHGSLVMRDCNAVSSLPDWVGRLSHLDLSGCAQLADLPEGLEVTSWVDVGGTALTGLPASLRGASLRWRGVRVDERIAFHPEQLTAREALAERNAELRRVMIERIGYLRFAQETDPKVLHQDVDRGGPRQLLRIELDEDEPLVGLSCRCPSTGRAYWIRVPPTTETCHQAAAWVAGFDDPAHYHPDLET